ncbi:MAG: lipocalin family protein [Burkholderiaceae bacterium]
MKTLPPSLPDRRIGPFARIGLIATISAAATLAGCTGAGPLTQSNSAVVAVQQLDPDRYAGQWFEIARLPNRFQNQCVGNVTATYTQNDGGGLSVTNRCMTENGTIDEAVGRVRRVSDTQAKLKVSFLPSLLSTLSWLPFGWGDYWVLDLAGDYSHALVGTPDNKYLWLLSRDSEMPEPEYFKLMQKASAMGFDTDKVVRTTQGLIARQAANK